MDGQLLTKEELIKIIIDSIHDGTTPKAKDMVSMVDDFTKVNHIQIICEPTSHISYTRWYFWPTVVKQVEEKK